MSMWTRSTPDMISLMTFCRGVALGRSPGPGGREEVAVDESEEGPQGSILQLQALGAPPGRPNPASG